MTTGTRRSMCSTERRAIAAWRKGLPLLRIKNEVSRVRHGSLNSTVGEWRYVAPNMFAGSIFDLAPDTEYDCMFTMSDPDGIVGSRGSQDRHGADPARSLSLYRAATSSTSIPSDTRDQK